MAEVTVHSKGNGYACALPSSCSWTTCTPTYGQPLLVLGILFLRTYSGNLFSSRLFEPASGSPFLSE